MTDQVKFPCELGYYDNTITCLASNAPPQSAYYPTELAQYTNQYSIGYNHPSSEYFAPEATASDWPTHHLAQPPQPPPTTCPLPSVVATAEDV